MSTTREMWVVYRRYAAPTDGGAIELHDVATPIAKVDWQDVLACPEELQSVWSSDRAFLDSKYPNMKRI